MEKEQVGYIYIRNHASYEFHNACKLGKASNIPERDSQYATGEIRRGYFELVIEMPYSIITTVERMLQTYFNRMGFHIKFDGGCEFYNYAIIKHILPYLEKTNIKFRVLSKAEISELIRCHRIRKIIEIIKDNLKLLRVFQKRLTERQRPTEPPVKFTPRPDQSVIINNSVKYFETNDKGLLVLMCGVGKTFISLWISQAIKAKTILIGVPNRLLLNQWELDVGGLFPNSNILLVSGGINKDRISTFLSDSTNELKILITTYASSHKVNSVAKNMTLTFDVKILDEAHHLTTQNMALANKTKTYVQMLNINSAKQLGLTATLKLLENQQSDGDAVVANDNIVYFGNIIDRKCLLWAINENIICDYNIQTIITDENKLEKHLEKFNITEENDKRLFLSAFASLKSIYDGHSHHLLIYSNNTDSSAKLIQYIGRLLEEKYFNIPDGDICYSSYHSEMPTKTLTTIIERFEKSKYGIITCVYCLGEGWNFPLLDGVVFAENMSSAIRILQSALRACRKYKIHPNKVAKIIIPMLNTSKGNLFDEESPDLKKVREIIYQMGLEDETVSQKIKVFRISIKKQTKQIKAPDNSQNIKDLGEYDEHLTQLLRLTTIRRTELGTTYEKARKIIAEKQIGSKLDYFELCKRDDRLSSEPETVFKGRFTNWIEYLSIPRIYYDLETCIMRINHYLQAQPSLKDNYLNLAIVCEHLCKLDKLFPPVDLWTDYYSVSKLSDLINTDTRKKKKLLSTL